MRFNASPCSRSSRASSRSIARVPPLSGTGFSHPSDPPAPARRRVLSIEGQSFELDMGDCLFLPKGKTYSAEVLGNDPVWLLEASKSS